MKLLNDGVFGSSFENILWQQCKKILCPGTPPVDSDSFIIAEKVKGRSAGRKSQVSSEPVAERVLILCCVKIPKQSKMPKSNNGKTL